MGLLALMKWGTRGNAGSSPAPLPGFLQTPAPSPPLATPAFLNTPGPLGADTLTLSGASSQPKTSGAADFSAADAALAQSLAAELPAPPPAAAPAPAQPAAPTPAPAPASSPDALKAMTPAQLARLGATDKQAFFDALRPAAEAAQQQYGVPAAVTLAQAALESGWAAHAIGGYNIFGIKGTGPAGSVNVPTQEYENGRYVNTNANFAKYDNFYQAVQEHGKLFHNGAYDKALSDWQKNHDVSQFANDLTGVYATSPTYGSSLMNLINTYHLA